MSTTAQDLIKLALTDIGVLSTEAPLSPGDATQGLLRLNQMIDSWATQPKTMRFIARQVFHVVANQSTYTMGPGGDFDTTTPQGLTGAGLLLNGSSPPVEIPRGLLTDDGYEAIQIKDLPNTLWTNVYFRPTYSTGLATVILWPVPTTAANDCVLYRRDVTQGFANLTTAYTFPYGYAEALEYNLAVRLATVYGRPLQNIPELVERARQSLALIKRANYTLTDLPMDPALTHSPRGGYNINTGLGGASY